MKNSATQFTTPLTNSNTNSTVEKPIGSLPRRYSPKFAQLMQGIRHADRDLADAIQEQIVLAQVAEKKARRLLAQYRIAKRRAPVLRLLKPQS